MVQDEPTSKKVSKTSSPNTRQRKDLPGVAKSLTTCCLRDFVHEIRPCKYFIDDGLIDLPRSTQFAILVILLLSAGEVAYGSLVISLAQSHL